MRFKEFLMREDGVAAKHLAGAKMTLDEMVEWVDNNASRFMKTGSEIFRGIRADNAEGLYNGLQLKRKAANTLNYANLWLSNHTDWSGYPQRDKSFICSTSKWYTESYGDTYLVIPADSTNIGICPDQDLWDSFSEIDEASDGMGMDELMATVHKLIQPFKPNSDAAHDWDILAYDLNAIGHEEVKHEIENSKGSFNDVAESLSNFMSNNNLDSLYQVFEHIFDPRSNGFGTQKAATFEADEDREVWMSGSVLIVSPETWKKIKSQLDN